MAELKDLFFVYVIESPSEDDIYNGMQEGELICQAITLNDLICESNIVISKESFEQCLTTDLCLKIKEHKKLPIIHFSCHSNKDEFRLPVSGNFPWEFINSCLLPTAQYLGIKFLLCMSSCKGLGAIQQCFKEEESKIALSGVVGNSNDIPWSDSAIAYTVFYHYLVRGKTILEAVDAMQNGSLNNGFRFISKEDAQIWYLQSEIQKLKEKLDQDTSNQ